MERKIENFNFNASKRYIRNIVRLKFPSSTWKQLYMYSMFDHATTILTFNIIYLLLSR